MKSYYDFSSISEVSYVDFSGVNINNDAQVGAALQDKDRDGRFSPIQAVNFVSKWDIKAHTPNTESGYSSTVFKSKTGANYVLTFRGTEPSDIGALLSG